MTNDIRTEPSDSFAGQRVRDELVIRLPTLTRLMRALLPEDAVRHIQAARKEQLLALRAVLDTAIERIDSAEHLSDGLRSQSNSTSTRDVLGGSADSKLR